MSDPPRPRSTGRLKAVLAVYVLAAALLPLSHHDVICHAKSTTHCSTCVIGSSAETTSDSAGLLRIALADAGAAVSARATLFLFQSLTVSSGRAPPAVL
jgi:hypothetical protein